jgi:hypothetical protein
MKKIHALIALMFAMMLAFTGCEVPDDSGTAADRADTKDAAKDKAKDKATKAKDTKSEKAKPDAPKETASQANARQAAAQYLDLTGFSREGLINQLINGDGYSKADATYGVDAQHANYNEQAALSAKQYLDLTSFSHQGLVDQLVQGDGYTKEQAEYGVNKVGL